MNVIKQRTKALGITQDDLASRLGVSLPTVKRWFVGNGVSLDQLGKLADEIGLSMVDIVVAAEEDAPKASSYSVEQERFLAKNPNFLAFFDHLIQGRSPHQIRKNFGFSLRKLESYLSGLEKVGLLEWLPGNRAKLLHRGEPSWMKNGPLSRRFGQEILDDFYENGKDGHFALSDCLEEDLELINLKISELRRVFRQAGTKAQLNPDKSRPYGLYVKLGKYRWSLDDNL